MITSVTPWPSLALVPKNLSLRALGHAAPASPAGIRCLDNPEISGSGSCTTRQLDSPALSPAAYRSLLNRGGAPTVTVLSSLVGNERIHGQSGSRDYRAPSNELAPGVSGAYPVYVNFVVHRSGDSGSSRVSGSTKVVIYDDQIPNLRDVTLFVHWGLTSGHTMTNQLSASKYRDANVATL